jgi:ATP-dependent helicase/nuclease subunit A
MGISWTELQKSVIDSRSGNLLVSAAAGSGKTAVLVERIIEMVKGVDSEGHQISEGIDVDELLVVTFTRAAAAQMKEKVAKALEEAAREQPYNEHIVKQLSLIHRADITTIDSFCLGIVKDNFNVIGIDSSFDIADNAEMELIKNDVMEEVMEEAYSQGDKDFIHLVDCFTRKESDQNITELVYKVCKVASGYPKPLVWIDRALAALEADSREKLEQEAWFIDYMKHVQDTLSSIHAIALENQRVCREADGPEAYLSAITSDVEMIESLINCHDIDKLSQYDISWEKLKTIKAGSVNDDKKQFVQNNRNIYKKSLKKLISDMSDSDTILAELKLMAPPLKALLKLTVTYINRLSEVKREKNLYEFHDISEFAYDILCQGYDEEGHVIPSGIAGNISKHYREILIDEYQDSNYLQEDILNCVAGHGEGISNMFMVGDIKQSIYRFRMARPDLFLQKYNTYTEEVSDNRKILLANNFRSTISVIDTINKIFAPLMGEDLGGIKYDEAAMLVPNPALKPDSPVEKISEVILIENDSDELEEVYTKHEIEAIYIADKIHDIVNGDTPVYVQDGTVSEDGIPGMRKAEYRDIVILLRSTKKYAAIYDSAFEERGIPLYVESDSGYFDAVEISTIICMLAVVDNSYLDYELAAALRSPLAGITERTLARITGLYNRGFSGNLEKPVGNAYLYDKVIYCIEHCRKAGIEDNPPEDNAVEIDGLEEINGMIENSQLEKLEEFMELLHYLKANKNYMSISDMINYILDKTGYYWFVGAMKAGARRQANIDMLINKAASYEDSSFKGLFNFLRYVDRLKTNDIDFSEAATIGENENTVRIMTMHKSKGLEFPIVFVSGLGGVFSNMDARDEVIVHSDFYLSSAAIDTAHRAKKNTFIKKAMTGSLKREQYAEEMRVLYVALTRAKEKLYMTACVSDAAKLQDKCTGLVLNAGKLEHSYKLEASGYMQWILMALYTYDDLHGIADIQTVNAANVLWKALERNQDKAEQEEAEADPDNLSLEEELYAKYNSLINWSYPYKQEELLKSKMSITEIKRMQNQGEENSGIDMYNTDFSDLTEAGNIPVLASTLKEQPVHGNELGTVMHKLMELADFKHTDKLSVKSHVKALFENEVIDRRYEPYINPDKIYKMLNSGLGKRMAAADEKGRLYREQQFYVAMKPEDISECYAGYNEMVVVQGIVDAYFIEDGEIVLMDYKTDHVENIEDLVTRYHVQLDKYAQTLEQLTGLHVKEKVIYAFHFDDSIIL